METCVVICFIVLVIITALCSLSALFALQLTVSNEDFRYAAMYLAGFLLVPSILGIEKLAEICETFL